MHPELAQALNNLAGLYARQDRYAEAEALYLRTLAIREQRLESNHPDIVHSLSSLAALYVKQGKYAEAKPFYQHAFKISQQIFGEDDVRTVTIAKNLSYLEVQGSSDRKSIGVLARNLLDTFFHKKNRDD